MKLNGAQLVVKALETLGIRHTFGIPGVHNTEIYDALAESESITPHLVTHEMGAAFIADAISRVSDQTGTLVIVPAAGTTHALSGIGEAMLDGIPMLVICGGIRSDSGKYFQLHQIEQREFLKGIVKSYTLVKSHFEIIPALYQAFQKAHEGTPGPVFVEIPSNLLLFCEDLTDIPLYLPEPLPILEREKISQACQLLDNARQVGIYLGWGAKEACELSIQLAEHLQAPVCTSMQGISVFPHSHPLHCGMGFGPSAVPAAQAAFKNVDCLLSIGVRFGELATGSYGFKMPKTHIHSDINPNVFNKNYDSDLNICGDAKQVLEALLTELSKRPAKKINSELHKKIKTEKIAYFQTWKDHNSKDRVNPGLFFASLREKLADDAYLVLDDGNHTFLAAELFEVRQSKHMISPTDFNAMGYCVPASIGVKLAFPEKQVVGIVGDGGFLMTGMELLTANTEGLGVIIFIFNDGELAQISQLQKIPFNQKTCTVLGEARFAGLAMASGSHFLELKENSKIEPVIQEALDISRKGQAVLVDVKIDYSKKTQFTKGIVKTNLSRFPLRDKLRFIGRALKRRF